MSAKERLLILSVSGIGNTILQSPLIRSICESNSYSVDIIFGNCAMADVFNTDEMFNEIFYLPSSFPEKLELIKELRTRRYSTSIACFPSNRFQFHLLPFLLGVPTRIAHCYTKSSLFSLGFLSNKTVSADPSLHDVEQNLSLLSMLDIEEMSPNLELSFRLNEKNTQTAKNFMSGILENQRKVIGIHAGCNKSESYRRWPAEHFVALINQLNDEKIDCLLFAGPDEIEEVRAIFKALKYQTLNQLVEAESINDVGAIIKYCHAFLSTDSGLGHVATAVGVPTLAIFGPALHTRTAPYGKNGHHVRLGLECSPCLKYPFEGSSSKINCPYDHRCLKELSAQQVYSRLIALV